MSKIYINITLSIAMMLLVVGSVMLPTPVNAQVLDPSTLTKYIDPLPLPGVLQPTGTYKGQPLYEVPMYEAQQQLHSELGPTTIWGYYGLYPGPTMEARTHQSSYVRWINDLPTTHLFNVDTTVHGAQWWIPEVRSVVHLHGGHVPAASDGWPEDWFVPGQSDTYFYPNNQDACTIWYHDHSLGITRLNVYAGLAAFWIVRDRWEDRLNLPSGDFEVPVLLQDRSFYENGEFYYPDELEPEFFGDAAVINGKVWPYFDVQPRKYRFRFLNGCTARFMNIKLLESDEDGNIMNPEVPGPAFYQIGSDGGFMENAVMLNDPDNPMSPRLLMSPAERCDVIIDFSGYEGQYFVLHNNAGTPFKFLGQPDDEVPLPELMMFRVGSDPVEDNSSLPMHPRHVTRIPQGSSRMTRDLTLEEGIDQYGRLIMLLNGMHWDHPITELPQLGSTEIWRLINLTEDTHPIHLHLVFFQILDRQPFDVDEYMATGNLVFTGPAVPPDPNESGWKDTFRVNPGEVGRIIARYQDYTGKYVWHCHILEHEDYEMMRPFEVIKGNSEQSDALYGNERVAPVVNEPTYSFQLDPNYPSPFNPTTTISYSLAESAPAKLVIYDIQGRTVATLVDDWKDAGVHRVTFDGSKLASGVYFYQLTSSGQTQTKKMILMK